MVQTKGSAFSFQALMKASICSCSWETAVKEAPLEGQLRAWASAYRDRVRICNDVKHADVPAYLNAMDVLAAPSGIVKHGDLLQGVLVGDGAESIEVVGKSAIREFRDARVVVKDNSPRFPSSMSPHTEIAELLDHISAKVGHDGLPPPG